MTISNLVRHEQRLLDPDPSVGSRTIEATGRSLGAARRVGLILGALSSVAPLLAWVFEMGSFRTWFLAAALPGAALLTALNIGALSTPDSRRVVRLGVVAGIVGTIGYDVFRIPFVFGAGLRLLSPIESYGVLLLGTDRSSGWTDLAGWSWHLTNGIGFAIAYLAVAAGRRWHLGLAWAMVLETATIATPFGIYYGLAGKHDASSSPTPPTCPTDSRSGGSASTHRRSTGRSTG